MPLPLAQLALFDGVANIPYTVTILKTIPVLVVLYYIKVFFQGRVNKAERNLHGKVVMVTGGTSGIGEHVVRGLSERGAQIVLLVKASLGDPFLVEYIEDLRSSTNNELITAEQVDLASLHSIRTFATKWIDNAPPRRLDMVVLCANTMTPRGGKLQSTKDDVEVNWAVNYLANFHLLSILSPAIRAQPPDRDVRIIMGTCISYLGGELPVEAADSVDEKSSSKKAKRNAPKAASTKQPSASFSPGLAYASSKLALMTFAYAFQKHLSAYARPDKAPFNARVILVDPGFTRTPGMRRHLSWGSITGLFLYLIMYSFWWLVLKSPDMGAQSFLHAAMEASYGRGEGGQLIKECRQIDVTRTDTQDVAIQKALWEYSEGMIEEAEKRGAQARANARSEAEMQKKAAEMKKKKEEETKPAPSPKPKEPLAKQPTSRRSRKAT